eukprot:31654-Amphidinium_carterae.1
MSTCWNPVVRGVDLQLDAVVWQVEIQEVVRQVPKIEVQFQERIIEHPQVRTIAQASKQQNPKQDLPETDPGDSILNISDNRQTCCPLYLMYWYYVRLARV